MNNIIHILASLVQGCNTPHGINVLCDYIQEITGYPPEFHESGWSEGNSNIFDHIVGNGSGFAYGYGVTDGNGNGFGYGGYGQSNNNGCGYGPDYSNGNGNGYNNHYLHV